MGDRFAGWSYALWTDLNPRGSDLASKTPLPARAGVHSAKTWRSGEVNVDYVPHETRTK